MWLTVKDPRDLHSDWVPVGWTELCLSLPVLPLAPVPKLASALLRGAGGGGRSEGSLWRAATSLYSTYSTVNTDMFTHSAEKLEPSSPCDFLGFQISSFKLSGFQEWKRREVDLGLDSLLTHQVTALMWTCRPWVKQRSINYLTSLVGVLDKRLFHNRLKFILKFKPTAV